VAGFPREKLGGKYMSQKLQKIDYDEDWVQMIKKAKNMGLTPREIRVMIKRLKKHSQYTS